MRVCLPLLLIFFVLGISQPGHAQHHPVEARYDYIPVTRQNITDSSLLTLLKPYRDSMQKAMGKVIGFTTVTLYQKQPESPLGNFMADAMRIMGEKKFNRKIDVALANYGASRQYIPKGEITLQNTFDLMPYDNLILLQEIKGVVLKQLLDYAAQKGGWAVSGITMQVKDRKADSIRINGVLLDDETVYTVANTDYIIRGGPDNITFLKTIPSINVGYLYREALIDYIISFTQKGKPVTAAIERRVVNVDQ